MQNYKNYFVPSFSLGTRLTFSQSSKELLNGNRDYFGNRIFYLQKMHQNKLRTYRNDFLTFTYGQGGTKDHDPGKDFSFSAVFSFGYLIKQKRGLF